MIAVFFGGRSCEHDISIITGLQALSACTERAAGIYIDSRGEWWTARSFDSVNAVRNNRFNGRRVHIRPDGWIYHKNKRLFKPDVALLCMHGMLGEDGALQGLLEMCGVPYTGSGIAASAIGMDKLRAKAVFERAGLKVLPYFAVARAERRDCCARAAALGYPVIVKPCNLGSSIGISLASDEQAFLNALDVAFEWDDRVIVEKALTDFTEVNCAALGDSAQGELLLSETEQPVGWKSFLTFADKYSGDVKSTRHRIPADISDEHAGIVRECTELAFRAVGCCGVARVDFLIKDEVYVNEINTIPGSLAYGLFAGEIGFSKLISRLCELAVRRKERFDALKRLYTPTVPLAGK